MQNLTFLKCAALASLGLSSLSAAVAQTATPPATQQAEKKPRPPSPAQIAKMFKTASTAEERAAAFAALAPFAQSGDPAAQRLQARELARDQRYPDALAALGPLIAANDEEGLDMAAKLVANRKSGLNDPAAALNIYERLMELGDLDALAKVAKAHLAGQMGRITPQQIRTALEVAAGGGISNLSSYLAEFQSKGIGGPTDQAGAIASLKAAAEAGEKGSKADLATALLASDDPDEVTQSLDLLTQLAASESASESFGAKVKLAIGHGQGAFGAASDAAMAISLTTEILAHENAAKVLPSLLRAAAKDDAAPEWRDFLLQTLQSQIDAGDETNLNTVFTYFASRRDAGNLAQAQALYDRFQAKITSEIVPSFLIGQGIDTGNPMAQAGTLVGLLDLATTPGAREKAYLAATKNQNLFTYFMQDLAQKKGVYTGRLSGQMDSATIRAVLQICKEGGVVDACEAGPLKRKNAQIIARAAAGLATGLAAGSVPPAN